ncbi:MAG: precorrin-2 C(20)-methyltransferase [Clostridia bacterium]
MSRTEYGQIHKGTFYGVSVGPGDPELITLKAVRRLQKCSVVAVPRTRGENNLALDIVSNVVDLSEMEIVYLDFLMISDQEALDRSHTEQANKVCVYLAAGRDVAMLNLGDASLFGTYRYLADLVRSHGYETITIPGVTSFCAVAAALDTSLTSMKQPLHIFPASFADLDGALALDGTKVLMKSASALPRVKQAIEAAGLSDRTSLVANCGLPDQRVYPCIADSGDNEGYFATILIKP